MTDGSEGGARVNPRQHVRTSTGSFVDCWPPTGYYKLLCCNKNVLTPQTKSFQSGHGYQIKRVKCDTVGRYNTWLLSEILSERERERERERDSVCVCVRERERERDSVCVCVRERESVCVCVCV